VSFLLARINLDAFLSTDLCPCYDWKPVARISRRGGSWDPEGVWEWDTQKLGHVEAQRVYCFLKA